MQTKISAHLAVTAGLPIVMLGLIAAIVSITLGTVNSSQETVFALVKLERTTRDVVVQEYRHRFATRGFVLTLRPSDSSMREKARDAITSDFATLGIQGGFVAELPQLIATAKPIALQMIDRDDAVIAAAKRDRRSVIDAYLRAYGPHAAHGPHHALAANAADAALLDQTSKRIEDAVAAAQRAAESAAVRAVTLAVVALLATLACTAIVVLAIALWFRRTRAALGDSETRYSALTEAMPQIIWIHDEQHKLEYVNERWSLYTGLIFTPNLQAQLILPSRRCRRLRRHRKQKPQRLGRRVRSALASPRRNVSLARVAGGAV